MATLYILRSSMEDHEQVKTVLYVKRHIVLQCRYHEVSANHNLSDTNHNCFNYTLLPKALASYYLVLLGITWYYLVLLGITL
jgi:hypothetical protein